MCAQRTHMDAAKTARIVLRTTPKLKTRAASAASRDGRTLTNYIERLIREDLAKEPKR